MKKDRTIQYRGWNVEYSGLDHWYSFGLAGYLVFEFDIDEDSLSFGDLESALDWIDDVMADREYDEETFNL